MDEHDIAIKILEKRKSAIIYDISQLDKIRSELQSAIDELKKRLSSSFVGEK